MRQGYSPLDQHCKGFLLTPGSRPGRYVSFSTLSRHLVQTSKALTWKARSKSSSRPCVKSVMPRCDVQKKLCGIHAREFQKLLNDSLVPTLNRCLVRLSVVTTRLGHTGGSICESRSLHFMPWQDAVIGFRLTTEIASLASAFLDWLQTALPLELGAKESRRESLHHQPFQPSLQTRPVSY